MKDNIGNEISIGDLVFCYSGQNKNTIQKVAGFRYCNGEALNGITEAVNFDSRSWVSATNVVSLTALGADISYPDKIHISPLHDALGNPLQIGDKVLYLHHMEMFAQVGIIKNMGKRTCLLSTNKNRFGQTEYRKKYEEIISLAYLGIDKVGKIYDDE